MTVGLLVVALAVAAVDWAAVAANRRQIEGVAKPLVMVVLIVAALAAGGGTETQRWLIASGLVFGLAGDLLLLPHVNRFVWGLGSFLIGHVFYSAAFLLGDLDGGGALVGAVVAVALIAFVGRSIIRAVRSSRLYVPVVLYIATIGVMVAAAWSTTSAWFAAGALVFAASDGLLGHDRFVTPRTDRRVVVHLLYHLGQAAIVLGLA